MGMQIYNKMESLLLTARRQLDEADDVVCETGQLNRVCENIFTRLIVGDKVAENPGTWVVLWELEALLLVFDGGVDDLLVPLEPPSLNLFIDLDIDIVSSFQEKEDVGGDDHVVDAVVDVEAELKPLENEQL